MFPGAGHTFRTELAVGPRVRGPDHMRTIRSSGSPQGHRPQLRTGSCPHGEPAPTSRALGKEERRGSLPYHGDPARPRLCPPRGAGDRPVGLTQMRRRCNPSCPGDPEVAGEVGSPGPAEAGVALRPTHAPENGSGALWGRAACGSSASLSRGRLLPAVSTWSQSHPSSGPRASCCPKATC